MKEASLLEQWAYFLLRAESLTMDEIKRILPDEVFSEAASVLEVVAKTPEQKRISDSRLKFQRDEAARNKFAREEALREGREEGVLLGRIATLQELLGINEPTIEELSKHDLGQLTAMVSKLREQLRTRSPL